MKIDPVPVLSESSEKAIVYFTKRDLLGEAVEPLKSLRALPEPQKLLRRQNPDGSWGTMGKDTEAYPRNRDLLLETFKRSRLLIERYQFNRTDKSIDQAAEFLFTFQTPAGDIRGMIGNQYATYYTGYILSLLNKAGYAEDPRIEKGIRWLLSMRQNDGGWTIPILTQNYTWKEITRLTSGYTETVEPDLTKPFSHNWTNMVLSALASHPRYRNCPEARQAGSLLKSRFFQEDVYTSYQAADYWTRFQFWWPNLLTALESLSLIGFSVDDPDVQKALDWFYRRQAADGLWDPDNSRKKTVKSPKNVVDWQWLGLSICRMLKFYAS